MLLQREEEKGSERASDGEGQRVEGVDEQTFGEGDKNICRRRRRVRMLCIYALLDLLHGRGASDTTNAPW